MSSYEEIYGRMKQTYKENTGVEIDDASDTGLRFAILASEVYSLLCNCEWLKRQMFADTAVGEALDLHAAQRSLTRKSAAPARGEVEFSVTEPAQKSIVIPEGTVVSTEDTVPVRFATTQECTIKVGSVSAIAEAQALSGGKSGNAAAGKITTIVTALPYVEAVCNRSAFKGGTDDESDESLRRRVIESYRNISNGTNKAYYRSICEKIDGVGSVGVIPRNRGVGTVDVFLAGQTTTASAEAVSEANKILKAEREVNVDAQAFAAEELKINMTLYVAIDEKYDENEVAELCREEVVGIAEDACVGEDIVISGIIARIMQIDGVTDVTVPSSYKNYSIADNVKPVAGNISITVQTGDAE